MSLVIDRPVDFFRYLDLIDNLWGNPGSLSPLETTKPFAYDTIHVGCRFVKRWQRGLFLLSRPIGDGVGAAISQLGASELYLSPQIRDKWSLFCSWRLEYKISVRR